jgi:uncharacterized membrane protein YfcA
MEILFIALVVLVASFAGTVAGFGISSILIPFVSLFLPLPQTLLLVGSIHWFGDIWQLLLFRKGVKWTLILAFGLPGVALSFAGARLTFVVDSATLLRILGGLLIAYVMALAIRPDLRLPRSTPVAIGAGATSGFSAGFFGVSGPITGAFLSAYDLPKAIYIATGAAIGLAFDTTRLTTYIAGGTRLEAKFAWAMLIFVPLSFVGAFVAQRVVHRIPQGKFRAVVAVALLAFGVKLLLFP